MIPTRRTKSPRLLFFLFLLIIITQQIQADDLAIMLFDFKGMDKIEITDYDLIRSIITDDLYSTMDCEVLSGIELEELLSQNGFNACDGIDCISRIGQNLDIPIAITGVFNTSRGKYSLNLNLINTTTAKLITSQHLDGPLEKIGSELGWKLLKSVKSALEDNFGKVKLKIKTSPSRVAIAVDGEDYGRSPLTINELRRGFQYQFKFDKSGFESLEQSVVFRKRNEKIEISLPEIKGTLKFSGYPTSSKIYINNNFIGNLNDLAYNSVGGNYDLKVNKAGYKTYKEKLQVESGATQNIKIFLKKRSKIPPLLTSSIIPGSGQMLHSRWLRGFIILTAAAGVGYFTYQEYLIYDKNYTDYRQALNTYNDQRDLNRIDENMVNVYHSFNIMKDQEQNLNQFISALGVVWTINLFEILLY